MKDEMIHSSNEWIPTILSNGQLIPIFVILETRSELPLWWVYFSSSTTDTNLWFLVTRPFANREEDLATTMSHHLSSDKLLEEQPVKLTSFIITSSRLIFILEWIAWVMNGQVSHVDGVFLNSRMIWCLTPYLGSSFWDQMLKELGNTRG